MMCSQCCVARWYGLTEKVMVSSSQNLQVVLIIKKRGGEEI